MEEDFHRILDRSSEVPWQQPFAENFASHVQGRNPCCCLRNGCSTATKVTLQSVWLAPSGAAPQLWWLALPVPFRVISLASSSRECRCRPEESTFKVHTAWKGWWQPRKVSCQSWPPYSVLQCFALWCVFSWGKEMFLPWNCLQPRHLHLVSNAGIFISELGDVKVSVWW